MGINEKIKKRKILVIGDIMLDIYVEGEISRISPEAPIPVLLKENERYVLGGASNVAANLVAANQDVKICSIIGNDTMGEKLIDILKKNNIDCSMLITSEYRCTTTKTRIIGQNHQQIVRVDEEDTFPLAEQEEYHLIDMLRSNISQIDIVIISDYMKGVLTPSLCKQIIQISKDAQKKVIVDVKDKNISKYNEAYLLKPNLKELQDLTGLTTKTENDIITASRKLLNTCKCQYVLTTCGGNGMYIIGLEEWKHEKCVNRNVYDVSGAGDTVISYVGTFLANNLSIFSAIKFANIAAGIKVSKAGTAAVTLEELNDYLKTLSISEKGHKKIITINDFKNIRKNYPEQKIVFTNGCFDILHYGHINYLKEAAQLGDWLIIGLNSDCSVKRLKGNLRPINVENERAELLAALEFVNYVIIFDEDTPYNLIKIIQPDVLVKGGDYKPELVIGKDIVEKNGGYLKIIPFVAGHSTTSLISKLSSYN